MGGDAGQDEWVGVGGTDALTTFIILLRKSRGEAGGPGTLLPILAAAVATRRNGVKKAIRELGRRRMRLIGG